MHFPDLKKFAAAINMIAPAIAMVVPHGDLIMPYIPLVITAMADAQADRGKTGTEKRNYVVKLVVDAADIANTAKPGSIDGTLVGAVAGHYVDTVIGTLKIAGLAQGKMPDAPVVAHGLIG